MLEVKNKRTSLITALFLEHTCREDGCWEPCYSEYYCISHQCYAEDCLRPTFMDDLYCAAHTCRNWLSGQENAGNPDVSEYCLEHTCEALEARSWEKKRDSHNYVHGNGVPVRFMMWEVWMIMGK